LPAGKPIPATCRHITSVRRSIEIYVVICGSWNIGLVSKTLPLNALPL
jgi:hypothetical protein